MEKREYMWNWGQTSVRKENRLKDYIIHGHILREKGMREEKQFTEADFKCRIWEKNKELQK